MRERGEDLMPRTIASFGLLIMAPGSGAISVVSIISELNKEFPAI